MRPLCAAVLGLVVFAMAGSARADDAAKLLGKWEVTKSGGDTPMGTLVEFAKDNKMTANVNLGGQSCNANASATVINFYRAGGGCQNTATMTDIVAHEYGHCIQASLNGGQGPNGQGEGNADIAATYFDDGSVIGVGIMNCSDGVSCPGTSCRDCENTLQWPDDAIGAPIHAG